MSCYSVDTRRCGLFIKIGSIPICEEIPVDRILSSADSKSVLRQADPKFSTQHVDLSRQSLI